MTRTEKIQWLLANMFQNPTPTIKDWRPFLGQMTDEELDAIIRVQQLDDAGILTPNDLLPMIKILEKHSGGTGVILEHHDPRLDLDDSGQQNN